MGRQTITVEGQNTVRDYVHGYRMFYARRRVTKITRILAVGLLALGAWSLAAYGPTAFSITVILAAPVVWFQLLSTLKVYLRAAGNPRNREPYRAVFDESGLQIRSQSVNANAPWSSFDAMIEDDRMFLLVMQRRNYIVFPKRVFGGSSDMDAFRELARRKVRR